MRGQFQTINSLNPSFMKQIIEVRETNKNVRKKYRLNLNILNYNQVTFGKKCLRIFGPKTFKTVIKNWDGVNCKCVICKKI